MTNRTRIFFYVTVVLLLTELVSPPLGSYLMEQWNSYYAYLFGLPLEMFGFVVLLFIPETAKVSPTDIKDNPRTRPVVHRLNVHLRLRSRLQSLRNHVNSEVLPLLRKPALVLALVALFVNRFSRSILKTLMQYLSARFGWKISQVCQIPKNKVSN